MFVLDCDIPPPGPSGPVRVNCFGSRDIATVECIYDGGEIVEACECVILIWETPMIMNSNCCAYMSGCL